MEFEEMKKIWNTQNNEAMYTINEKVLHDHILSKKKQAGHITNVTELLLIFVNIGAGLFILGVNLFDGSRNIFMYLMSAWMCMTAFYVLVSRVRRIQGEYRFDRTMLGDLNHSISTASYQVFLSQTMRWNILPIAALTVLGIWNSGKSGWFAVGVLVFFAIAHFASGWEHNIYERKKQELKKLKMKLKEE